MRRLHFTLLIVFLSILFFRCEKDSLVKDQSTDSEIINKDFIENKADARFSETLNNINIITIENDELTDLCYTNISQLNLSFDALGQPKLMLDLNDLCTIENKPDEIADKDFYLLYDKEGILEVLLEGSMGRRRQGGVLDIVIEGNLNRLEGILHAVIEDILTQEILDVVSEEGMNREGILEVVLDVNVDRIGVLEINSLRRVNNYNLTLQ